MLALTATGLFFGDIICATRPHVVCPVPVVEVDTSDNDLLLSEWSLSGGAGEMSVAAEYDGSRRCRVFIVDTATSKAEEGDLVWECWLMLTFFALSSAASDESTVSAISVDVASSISDCVSAGALMTD